MSLQELHLADFCPDNGGPGSRGRGGIDSSEKLELLEHDAACRRQAGYAVREIVSQLPSLTCLRMSGVKAEDHGHDFANLHPWTQLK